MRILSWNIQKAGNAGWEEDLANFAEGVYWGDTHLHTAFSMDAGAFGNRLGIQNVAVRSATKSVAGQIIAPGDHRRSQ